MNYEDELETLSYYLYMSAQEGKPNVEYNPFSSESEPPKDEEEEENYLFPE